MKHQVTLTICLLLFVSFTLYAQTKPKPKEKAPTQKEMQEMMKEMQQGMDELSEEDKKEMEKMGIKMPDIKTMQKTISGVSDKQLKKAWEDDSRIVPKKDDARINKALAVSIANSEVAAYVRAAHQHVLSKLSPVIRSKAQTILQQSKSLKKPVAYSAIGFWIDGKLTIALYLMGEAVNENPENGNNLNNYAAMLSMCGAEEIALPILNNLNKRYPKNSSILNNIAQAWLGLGDIGRADKYADSTIRLAASHPQANMAKCLIEESKGNIPAAIAAAKKSIKKSFSTQKQNKLAGLGYKLKQEDLSWDKPMPQDPMGLEKFVWPEYPYNVDKSIYLEKRWKEFKDACNARLEELASKRSKLEVELENIHEQRTQRVLDAAKTGNFILPIPAYAIKASVKLQYLVADEDGTPVTSFVFAKEIQKVVDAYKKTADFDDILDTQEAAFNKTYDPLFGEGLPNPFEAACSEQNGIRNNFLGSANAVLENANKSYINTLRRKISDHLYYYQYTTWPEEFEIAKISAQMAWLSFISTQKVAFQKRSSFCQLKKDKDSTSSLQNFDDVACKYVSTMNLGVYSITQQCSNLIGKFDFGGLKIDIKDNVETNKMNGTVILGVSKGFDGPMGTEVEVSAGGLVEFDNTGITDVGVIAGVEATVAGQTIIGAEATMTVNSGTSVSGKGVLQGINN